MFQTLTVTSVLQMIDSPCCVFSLELEQHKFVEESRKETKNPVSTKGSVPRICTKSRAWAQSVQRCEVEHVFRVQHGIR